MNPDLAMIHRLDAVEAAAYQSMYAAAPDASLGISAEEIAGARLLICKALPAPFLNRVIGLGNNTQVTNRDLDQIVGAYRAAGLKKWWIHLSPSAQPDTLEEMLGMRGFTLSARKTWAKCARDNSPILKPKTSFEVRPLRPGEEKAFGETICAAFGLPASAAPWLARIPTVQGWKGVGAFDGGAMVGGGAVYIKGENGWLGIGGMRPAARGKHGHRALIAERVRIAAASGCRVIATETGEPMANEASPALDNILACGFDRVFGRLNYAAGA